MSAPGSSFLPPCGNAASGLRLKFGWPLNQNGRAGGVHRAADRVGGVGEDQARAASSPFGAKVTEWNPLIFHRTLSPRWMVMVLR